MLPLLLCCLDSLEKEWPLLSVLVNQLILTRSSHSIVFLSFVDDRNSRSLLRRNSIMKIPSSVIAKVTIKALMAPSRSQKERVDQKQISPRVSHLVGRAMYRTPASVIPVIKSPRSIVSMTNTTRQRSTALVHLQ